MGHTEREREGGEGGRDTERERGREGGGGETEREGKGQGDKHTEIGQ